MMEFKECKICIKKSGTPTLCDSCINNRQAISNGKSYFDFMMRYMMFIRDNGHTDEYLKYAKKVWGKSDSVDIQDV
jgi:hypothetical protein